MIIRPPRSSVVLLLGYPVEITGSIGRLHIYNEGLSAHHPSLTFGSKAPFLGKKAPRAPN